MFLFVFEKSRIALHLLNKNIRNTLYNKDIEIINDEFISNHFYSPIWFITMKL